MVSCAAGGDFGDVFGEYSVDDLCAVAGRHPSAFRGGPGDALYIAVPGQLFPCLVFTSSARSDKLI